MSNTTPPDRQPGFAARTVKCPACGGVSVYAPSNPYRPFCCKRCKNMDLGAWANEEFRVPTTPPLDAAPAEDNWKH